MLVSPSPLLAKGKLLEGAGLVAAGEGPAAVPAEPAAVHSWPEVPAGHAGGLEETCQGAPPEVV